MHIHIIQEIDKNTKNASEENSSGFRELFLITIRKFAFRLAITDPENIHSSKPEGLNLPPLKVHSRKLVRLQSRSKSSHCNLRKLPMIRFWDCWKIRQFPD